MAEPVAYGLIGDPSLTRAAMIPVGRRTFTDPGDDITEELGGLELATPGLLYDPLMGMAQTGAMLMGDMPVNPNVMTQTMLDAPLVSGLLSAATGAAPKGTLLGANVFHGGPHRFAPEPDFPHGRPRLDKIGTGEGAQAYGWGFYSAESEGVARHYASKLGSGQTWLVDEGVVTPSGNKDPIDFAVETLAKGLSGENRAEVEKAVRTALSGMSRTELQDTLQRHILPKAREGLPRERWSDYRLPYSEGLYKLDIPDADVAKYLDWDKPLSEQPKSVREALKKIGIKPRYQIVGNDGNYLVPKSYMTRQMAELDAKKVGGRVQEQQDSMLGSAIYKQLAATRGDQAASEALREAGIPGLKYFDGMSRDGGEGTRNYVTWDQDVLDRSKMLERDGVTLGANKAPTAALPGLLSDIRPARENIRTVIDANTIGGDVVGDETVPIGLLSGGASSSARAQKAIDDIAESMSGPEGFIERLIVDQDNNVIEGAHRLEALRKLGVDEVPVTRIVDPQALFTPDTKVAMRAAIQKAKKTNSDYENQIISQLGEMLADPDVAGDPKKVFEVYDPAKGFEDQFKAALKVIELGANKAPTAALPGLLGKVLDKRAEQMLLPPAERLQPSGRGVMDLSPEAYVRDTRQFSDDLMSDIPRQVAGKALPKAGRSQVIVDNMDDIATVLADRARSQMGTETQYFYHTGPIYEAARKAGLSKKEAGDFMRDFADAYAATSPRTPTEPNLRSASLVMAKDAAGIPFDTVVGPNAGRGLNETGYPMMIQEKGDISSKGKPATQTGIHKLLLQELQRSGKINKDTNPKPATFARNVEGNLSAPTIDTHAIRGALDALNELQPGAIPKDFIKPKFRKQYAEDPSSFDAATMVDDTLASAQVGGTKKQVEYAPFADLYKLMADKLGVSPAEAQSMGWFGSGAKTGLASEAKSVARLIDERIDVTAQALGVTPKEAARMFFRREIPLMANPATAALPSLLQDRSGNIDQRGLLGRTPRKRDEFPIFGLLGQRLYTATAPDGSI